MVYDVRRTEVVAPVVGPVARSVVVEVVGLSDSDGVPKDLGPAITLDAVSGSEDDAR